MWWLVRQTARHSPRRIVLAAVAAAFPVAVLAATLLFVDDSARSMTRIALDPVQVEQRALVTSLDVDVRRTRAALETVRGVRAVDVFGAANVVVSAPDGQSRVSARLIAVDPSYFQHHSWVHPEGDVRRGALVNGAVAASPGFGTATRIRIDLAGDFPPLNLSIPVAGHVDVREAAPTWFAIPAGDVQGDVAIVPRAVVIDFETFRRLVLPLALRTLGPETAVTNPGLTDLPQVSVEAHVAVDHAAYPFDPGTAARWSATLRRVLERRAAPGDIIVADNAAETLQEAGVDATNAKILFILLGLPGVLVAAALGLAAASALAEASRREDALLRLRGATDTQLARLAVGHGVLATSIGAVVGLTTAVVVVSLIAGHGVWHTIPLRGLVITGVVAALAGALTTAARLVPLVRAGRRSALLVERRAVVVAWTPRWMRSRLDVVAVVVGLLILGGNLLIGGIKPTPIQGQALALSFYVLLAPLALWLGVNLLVIRWVLGYLARRSQPDRPRPLTTWRATTFRWLGRRPARAAIALTLGALAVSFGTEVMTFVATYQYAKQTDATAAAGSDLRVTPVTDPPGPLPDLGSGVVGVTAIREVPARVGSDRKTVMAVDPATYASGTTARPQLLDGAGVEALSADRSGILVSQEIADDFEVKPGDTLPVTIYPDDLDLSQKLELHVLGVYRAIPPTDPQTEMVMSFTAVPPPLPTPDFYVARVSPGRSATDVARELHSRLSDTTFTVTTVTDRIRGQQRSLTALNLAGLGTIEAGAAGLIAALGVGVLGAFLVLERRREVATLRALGAGTGAALLGPALEGAVAAVGSVILGIPVGVGLGMLAVRVLGGFFVLPPPLVSIPFLRIAGLAGLVLLAAWAALTFALGRLRRVNVAEVLREP
jgi:putative ABC transport system permease protein